jgi:hypothetical protein
MREDDLEAFIRDRVEESLTLDYKRADSLNRSDKTKSEITKDISAFANSAGGRIIYGIAEDEAHKHLPARVDPVNSADYSKEWLDQIAGTIRPRVNGLVITPIRVGDDQNAVVYVVDIPQSSTAHQASDRRYYRRYNFESVAMYDHEIRDVMARSEHPRLDIALYVEKVIVVRRDTFRMPIGDEQQIRLVIVISNVGLRLAQYVFGTCELPYDIVHPEDHANRVLIQKDERLYFRVSVDNTKRDVVGVETVTNAPRYGTSWYSPILPDMSREVTRVRLEPGAFGRAPELGPITWWVHADNASQRSGSANIGDLKVVDRTS